MSIKKISFIALAIMGFASAGFAHNKPVSNHTVINFQKGQAQLTQSAKDTLRNLVKDANSQGQIATVEVAVWSDEPFPAGNQDLSKEDRDLASSRAANVRDYLKDTLNVSSVKTFNMAEGSNWLARAFRTDAAADYYPQVC
jgi:outer membrane protein OmpA-like peptidoglycan-associated protein